MSILCNLLKKDYQIPKGWGIWYHGTNYDFDSFCESKIGSDGACNTGLGFFFAKELIGVENYASKYLYVVAINEKDCDENGDFWCKKEKVCNLDPMGEYIDLPGSITRKEMIAKGYKSISIENLEGCGKAIAVFNSNDIMILDKIKVLEKSLSFA